jgi:hypothetical protein
VILLPHECHRTPESWAAACHEDRGLLPLFTCWLQDECDDPRRAAAVRWLAEHEKWPLAWARVSWWWKDDGGWDAGGLMERCLLPARLYEALPFRAAKKTRDGLGRRYHAPGAAVLDLLRVWTPELVREGV